MTFSQLDTIAEEYNGSYHGTRETDHNGDNDGRKVIIFRWDNQDDCDEFLEDERVCDILEYSSGDFENEIFTSCLRFQAK